MKLLLISLLLTLSNIVYTQNVGIGTTAPSDALHVRSTVGEDALRVQVGTSTKLRVFSNGGVSLGNNQSGTPSNGLYVHGNTGLGASSPQEKLVVEGNVDVRGEIKADGVAGTEGQYLTPDGTGNMVWENLSDCGFINARQYANGITSTWIVPSDVTLIKVELWGAGGDGGPSGGGGGGGYVSVFVKTTPSEVFTIEVGDNSGTGDSKVYKASNPTNQIIAYGGQDANASSPGYGGSFIFISSFNVGGSGINGESGSTTSIVYSQKSATEFMESTKYGDGGAAAYGFKAGGSFILKNANTGVKISDYRGRTGSYGAGGSGDENINAGVDGYVVIRW